MTTITTHKRRGVTPGRLTYEAEQRLRDAVQTLRNAAAESEEGTAVCIESVFLARNLEAYLQEYRGR